MSYFGILTSHLLRDEKIHRSDPGIITIRLCQNDYLQYHETELKYHNFATVSDYYAVQCINSILLRFQVIRSIRSVLKQSNGQLYCTSHNDIFFKIK